MCFLPEIKINRSKVYVTDWCMETRKNHLPSPIVFDQFYVAYSVAFLMISLCTSRVHRRSNAIGTCDRKRIFTVYDKCTLGTVMIALSVARISSKECNSLRFKYISWTLWGRPKVMNQQTDVCGIPIKTPTPL